MGGYSICPISKGSESTRCHDSRAHRAGTSQRWDRLKHVPESFPCRSVVFFRNSSSEASAVPSLETILLEIMNMCHSKKLKCVLYQYWGETVINSFTSGFPWPCLSEFPNMGWMTINIINDMNIACSLTMAHRIMNHSQCDYLFDHFEFM